MLLLISALLALNPVPSAKSPCPRRQLLSFVAHVGGNAGVSGADVYARANGDAEWLSSPIGQIAAGNAECALDSTDELMRAAQLQRRLIVEHACRIHPELRVAKRGPGIEMGVAASDGQVRAVPPPLESGDEPSAIQMLSAGFAGTPSGKKGIYESFADDGGALAYDREAVRQEIQELTNSEEVVLLAWAQCGFCTKARKLLAEEYEGQTYRDVTIGKFSPLHAELALTTGRPSVPYIFVDGVLAGGCHEDETHPGLLKTLEGRKEGSAPSTQRSRDIAMRARSHVDMAITSSPPRWHAEPIGSSDDSDQPIADTFREGDLVLVVPNAATAAECEALTSAGSKVAADYRKSRLETGLEPAAGLVRVPSIPAAARAALTNTPCAPPLPSDADAIVDQLLLRMMDFIDEELPSLGSSLFGADESDGGGLRQMHDDDALEFSSREPTVNVYSAGGEFLAHKDHQSLTVLIPLTDPDEDFEGGGTAFWRQDSRGHRVEAHDLLLRPPKGTALLFGGYTTHAGTPVECGERCVLVASFSRRGGKAKRRMEAEQSRDIYGDLL